MLPLLCWRQRGNDIDFAVSEIFQVFYGGAGHKANRPPGLFRPESPDINEQSGRLAHDIEKRQRVKIRINAQHQTAFCRKCCLYPLRHNPTALPVNNSEQSTANLAQQLLLTATHQRPELQRLYGHLEQMVSVFGTGTLDHLMQNNIASNNGIEFACFKQPDQGQVGVKTDQVGLVIDVLHCRTNARAMDVANPQLVHHLGKGVAGITVLHEHPG